MRHYRKHKRLVKSLPVVAQRKETSTTHLGTSKRAHNVVDALFHHFRQWYPDVIKDAESIEQIGAEDASSL